MTKHINVGTVGHIDHGKATLIAELLEVQTIKYRPAQITGMWFDDYYGSMDDWNAFTAIRPDKPYWQRSRW